MLGALAGDIIGSRFEFNNHKSKQFELFVPQCTFTDDSVLTVALADSLMSGQDYAAVLRRYYRRYPDAGYGGRFHQWAQSPQMGSYNSFGNGSAMRVSPVGWFFDDLERVLDKARKSAAPTHNHPEGIKAAQATAASIFMARRGAGKKEIKDYIQQTFNYDLQRSLNDIRPSYSFNVTCQGSVPEAIIAFLESTDYEDAIRNAVSLGGDSDTIACITGGIAEAFYRGVPEEIAENVWSILDPPLAETTRCFLEMNATKALRLQGRQNL
ncbi:MAG TPA: ADP-ribosylglycohydrolase family protein [Geoalkalibacter subterraneus]|uniref:ADP-ribosylglycohydrolase family protein n=1 Tax=Geoalkalibacter subterraneus TaxID=483547 RepID=A0A831PJQ2_9BACT|nr:ADP-ribosylglycohydrolase family protein [Geoalkalibacter subterraneus]